MKSRTIVEEVYKTIQFRGLDDFYTMLKGNVTNLVVIFEYLKGIVVS